MSVAVVTGGSKGLGLALVRGLAGRGWHVVTDARRAGELAAATNDLPNVTAIAGDVTDPRHRAALAGAAAARGGLDLLVNNASHLGPSPQPALAAYDLGELRRVYEVDVVAPLALVQRVLPLLRASGGTVVNVSSDAAVEPYEGWGGYGSAKAALDQLTAVLGAEQPDLRAYAFDPGDMRTELHQLAFPGEDISDRPEPEVAAAALLRLLDERPPSGRYRAAAFAPVGAA
ncbi:MAG TPA: SDR family oxidoreductase [Mycobacteriales bacterium]|jgi:NAD(P)-dependent dehydrogenase (short-subunit alcohol dehydrogenase family)|nr:SDR family oxidoreductase [Mycobacteriales bacterium]